MSHGAGRIGGQYRVSYLQIFATCIDCVCIPIPLAWCAMDRWLETFAYRIQFQWWMFAAAGSLAMGNSEWCHWLSIAEGLAVESGEGDRIPLKTKKPYRLGYGFK